MSDLNCGDDGARVETGLMSVEGAALEVREDVTGLVAGLSISQVMAFEVLTSGGTVAAAARAGNVSRKTIYVWLEEEHAFAAAYEQWKRSIAETSRTRLLMIGEAATVTVARAIKNGDTRAALAVVKGMGLLSPPAVGPSLTNAVARKKELEVSRAELEIGEKKKAVETFAQLVNVDGFSAEMRAAEGREGKE